MSERLFIAIPCYNRREIAGRCIPTVFASKAPQDHLAVYDDGSDEPFIIPECDEIVRTESMGIDAQRRQHFLDFWKRRDEFTHLYLTDSDAPHDPRWREHALSLQAEYRAPVCLYRTQTHADYEHNVYRDDPNERVVWQRFAPGVSYLLDLAMVSKVVRFMPERWSWDWNVPGMLGYKMAISRVSYCDHIGRGGLHDPECGIGPERAINPTPFLVCKREEIINELNAQAGQ